MTKKILNFFKYLKKQDDYILWLIKFTKPYIPTIFLLIGIVSLNVLIGAFQVVVSKSIIDDAIYSSKLSNYVYLYGAMLVSVIGLSALSEMTMVNLSERYSFGIRKQVYEHVINMKWLDVTNYHTGDLMTRLTSDTQNIADAIINTIPSIIILLVQLIVTFFILFYYSPFIAITAVMIGPIGVLISYYFARHLKRLNLKVQESEGKYRSFLQESISNVLVVKAFVKESYAIQTLVDLRENRFSWVKKKAKYSVINSAILGLMFQLSYLLSFIYGAFLITQGTITFGTMTIFISLIGRVQRPISDIASNFPKLILMLASLERIVELQNIPIESIKENEFNDEGISLTFDNLTFGYNKNEQILKDVSARIMPGEFVAIVGKSGIGKTTLVRLILSLVSAEKGRVEIKNAIGDCEEINAKHRENIAYVPQGNTLFSGTIRENLKMGKLQSTEDEMIEALKIADAWGFVETLPDGIDTVVGEKGHGLSEGQAQRIAIARAIIRKSPILILDEATSALDDKTEINVLKKIRALKPTPICIIITHRKEVLNYCNRELIINNKTIYEEKLSNTINNL